MSFAPPPHSQTSYSPCLRQMLEMVMFGQAQNTGCIEPMALVSWVLGVGVRFGAPPPNLLPKLWLWELGRQVLSLLHPTPPHGALPPVWFQSANLPGLKP